jgi:hypothetical protein
MTALKDTCMKLNGAELQHLLNYLKKERDDLLMFISFTKEYFVMDEKDFKEFKNFVLFGENNIDITEMLKEVILQNMIPEHFKDRATEYEEKKEKDE